MPINKKQSGHYKNCIIQKDNKLVVQRRYADPQNYRANFSYNK